jgi:hypothetical protein
MDSWSHPQASSTASIESTVGWGLLWASRFAGMSGYGRARADNVDLRPSL